MTEVVITAANRTPIGSYLGQFAQIGAPQLAASIIRYITKDTPDSVNEIDDCFIGCVLTAAVGQAPARQAILQAGLPNHIPCTTVNKVCGSGMKTLAIAYDAICSGSAGLVLAGGMESMSNAPYMLPGRAARQGMRAGHPTLLDHMFYDGLENHADGKLMGCFAERTAEQLHYSREQQDAYARQ